jgi:hypothetical protein
VFIETKNRTFLYFDTWTNKQLKLKG